MAGRWIVIQHVPWEGPGLIGREARARGLSVEVRRMDLGDAVPGIDEVAGLVVMGGPMGVRDASAFPHLAAEQQLLRTAVERQLPVLGVCLGAQLLAAALGARVDRGPAAEIGVGEVSLTADGCRDRVLGGFGATLPVIHWHEDVCELPAGATHLAQSNLCAIQASKSIGRWPPHGPHACLRTSSSPRVDAPKSSAADAGSWAGSSTPLRHLRHRREAADGSRDPTSALGSCK